MRLATLTCVLIGSVLFDTGRGIAEEPMPYTAFVLRDRTPVRSGPGDSHYITDRLERGEQVEVYQRTDGGWLGIRPPRESFSWIAQRDIQPTSAEGVGQVISRSAVSWIGSSVEDISDSKWLIRLELGERVAILGEERRAMVGDGRSDVYYKIAPPAGEFRWMHEADVVRNREELTIADPQVALADFRVAVKSTTTSPSPDQKVADETSAPANARRDDFKGRETNFSLPGGRRQEQQAPAATRSASRDQVSRDQAADLRTSRAETKRAEPLPANLSSGQFESRLRELDAKLSLMLSQPVEKWDFSVLRGDAQQMAARANGTLERARIQVFTDKVEDFESLRSRYALFASPPNSTDKPSPGNGKNSSGARPGSAGDTAQGTKQAIDPRFDGSGWLLPVHSTKRAAPPYALLDKEGNILQFVSPSPGMNLSRYLRKEVGIFGQREPNSTYDKPHLTAHRVVELDRHRR